MSLGKELNVDGFGFSRVLSNQSIDHYLHSLPRKNFYDKMANLTQRKVTKALEQSVQEINRQLAQSDQSLVALAQGRETTRKTAGKYSETGDLLEQSKQITQRLKNRDKYDRYLLYTGLAIFISTVIYIFWKRSWIRYLL
jgi:hypothetical protein